MFPKMLVEIVSLEWFILELNKLQTSPTSTGILKNEQVWSADFSNHSGHGQHAASGVHAIANLSMISTVITLRHILS